MCRAPNGQKVGMPIRDIPSSQPVVTSYNGRWWINELDRVGPVWGSFVTKDAAVAVGRALATDGRTAQVMGERGTVTQATSHRAPSCLNRRSEMFKASPIAVRTRSRAMISRS